MPSGFGSLLQFGLNGLAVVILYLAYQMTTAAMQAEPKADVAIQADLLRTTRLYLWVAVAFFLCATAVTVLGVFVPQQMHIAIKRSPLTLPTDVKPPILSYGTKPPNDLPGDQALAIVVGVDEVIEVQLDPLTQRIESDAQRIADDKRVIGLWTQEASKNSAVTSQAGFDDAH